MWNEEMECLSWLPKFEVTREVAEIWLADARHPTRRILDMVNFCHHLQKAISAAKFKKRSESVGAVIRSEEKIEALLKSLDVDQHCVTETLKERE